MRLAGKIIGVEASASAGRTKTTGVLKNKIFKLLDKYSQTPAKIAGIMIISLDTNDLKKIVFQKVNLLECMSRKIDEVKLDATKNLVELGLYDV